MGLGAGGAGDGQKDTPGRGFKALFNVKHLVPAAPGGQDRRPGRARLGGGRGDVGPHRRLSQRHAGDKELSFHDGLLYSGSTGTTCRLFALLDAGGDKKFTQAQDFPPAVSVACRHRPANAHWMQTRSAPEGAVG